jgi:hypothetical protein
MEVNGQLHVPAAVPQFPPHGKLRWSWWKLFHCFLGSRTHKRWSRHCSETSPCNEPPSHTSSPTHKCSARTGSQVSFLGIARTEDTNRTEFRSGTETRKTGKRDWTITLRGLRLLVCFLSVVPVPSIKGTMFENLALSPSSSEQAVKKFQMFLPPTQAPPR